MEALKPVWFITGCSTGIGRTIAQEALAAGHLVVATARNPQQLADLAAQHPKTCLTLPLDVTDGTAITKAVSEAERHFGRIDVLVNNAGYGLEGVTEELTLEQMRHQMEVNFFGLVAATKAVLPGMRGRKQGYIVNVSSIAGLRGAKGLPLYSASKFAVVGYSESLALEVKPFNIYVSIVEPGPYRTEWAGRSLIRTETVTKQDQASPYYEVNEETRRYLAQVDGKQTGDPRQIAQVLIGGTNLAMSQTAPPLHMLFGDEAIKIWGAELKRLQDPAFFKEYPHGTVTV